MKKATSISATIVRVSPFPAGPAVRESERAVVRILARQAAKAYVDALRDRAVRD